MLSPARDPFYAGGKGSKEKAEWFAAIWESEGFESGVHLRRIHYRLVSKEGITKVDGTPYENTQQCWEYLTYAASQARYLGLIDPAWLVDRRNPKPYLQALPVDYPEAGWEIESYYWSLPRVSVSLQDEGDWRMPSAYPVGYQYSDNLQPYHLEIWIEKSTMNDILEPLCDRYQANLIAGVGFFSITSATEFLERIRKTGKPCRIFYISDFDPSGEHMPVALARQIEYWKSYYSVDCDIKLKHIALTQEQVERYKLPSTPIKDSDGRKKNFKETYGQDATELDALEANAPGALGEMVQSELEKYYDDELESEYEDAYAEAWDKTSSHLDRYLARYEKELSELNDAKRVIVVKYRAELEKIQQNCQAELEPIQERLEKLHHAVKNDLDAARWCRLDLPPLPEPEIAGDDDDNWIYDSSLDYMEQLKLYAAYKSNGKGGDADEYDC